MKTSQESGTYAMVKNNETACEVENVETRRTYVPAVDVWDRDTESVIRMDVPGVAPASVEVGVENNVLTVKAKPDVETITDRTLIYSEYGIGNYERSFTLSDEADRENISAEIKDGVLRIRIPKVHAVSKRISVSAG